MSVREAADPLPIHCTQRRDDMAGDATGAAPIAATSWPMGARLASMGELQKPMMTPLGVLYRAYHDSEGHAFKSSEWAVKLFGGAVTSANMIGPGRKGYYEAAIMAKVPAEVQNVKPRKDANIDWQKDPTHAYVLYDSLETPLALYFYKHELLYKPSMKMTAYFTFSLDQ
jgi:hypothetical protein